MQAKTIALMGGTGFVGSTLTRKLTAAGWRVRILSRHPQRHRDLLVLPQVRIVRSNVLDAGQLAQGLEGCDAAVNLIGILNSRGRQGRDFEVLHARLPGEIAAACREQGVPRLLHMSALRADPEKGPSHYLRSKGAGEQAVRREAGKRVGVTMFQPSVIYGPDDSFINRFAALLRLPAPFMPLPKPNARFAPVYVGDVTDAMVHALEDRDCVGKTYQLCGPQVMSLREIVHMIADAIEVDRRIWGMPDSLARLQAFAMEFVPGKPLSRDNLLSMKENSICDVNGFEKLGMTPRSATTWIPRIARGESQRGHYDRYRRVAGR